VAPIAWLKLTGMYFRLKLPSTIVTQKIDASRHTCRHSSTCSGGNSHAITYKNKIGAPSLWDMLAKSTWCLRPVSITGNLPACMHLQ